MTKFLIAHDLGTSGDKATLFTTDGELVKKGQIPGLLDALTVCHGMNDVEVVAFDEHEVVRSGVAGELVRRYNRRRRLDDKTIQKFDAILKKYA